MDVDFTKNKPFLNYKFRKSAFTELRSSFISNCDYFTVRIFFPLLFVCFNCFIHTLVRDDETKDLLM